MPARFNPSVIRFVFLDRDGVINRKPAEGRYVTSPEELQLLPGSAGAVARLNRSGRTVIVLTNQRGIALGLYTKQDLTLIHAYLRKLLALEAGHLDAIYFCPHDVGQCDCRKPGIALFKRAFAEYPAANIRNSLLVGDSVSDIQAAERLHLPAFFIRGNPETRKPGATEAEERATAAFDSLAAAVGSLF